MNEKQRAAIEKLASGQPVYGYKEGGNSMTPLIRSMQPVTLHPVDTSKLEKGDVVLVKVRGRLYTHKVVGLRENEAQIGNNKGGINGWTPLHNVYGIVTHIGTLQVGGAMKKVRAASPVAGTVSSSLRG